MNGRNSVKFVLDTNVVIDRLNKKIAVWPGADKAETPQYFISVVTEMEALANPRDTEEGRKETHIFLSEFTIVPLLDEVKKIAIDIRRSGSPRSKLPDAIVVATAVVFDAVRITRDNDLLRLDWPGLKTMNTA